MYGPLILLSGPSGCGKSTVTARLLARGDLPLRQTISATTRPPRPGEQDGVHYHFWDRERFRRAVAEGAFLEWAEVHGNCYGTLVSEVGPYRARGIGVLLVIDVQGAAQVRARCPDALSVFLRTSTWEELERRLRRRGSEDEAAVQLRLANARAELTRASEYDVQIINDDLDEAVAALHRVIARAFAGPPAAGR